MNGKQLKNSILQWAIQGKLVPQNPKDEPASKLLERIAAQRVIASGSKQSKKNPASRIYREGSSWFEQVGSAEPKDITEEIPFDIPESWEWCRLSSLCVFLSRGKSPTYSDVPNNYPVFAQKCNLKNGGISLEQARFLNPETISKWAPEYHLKTGDVLVNSTGTGTVCRTRIFDELCLGNYPFVVPDSHVSVVRTVECFSSAYIFYAFNSKTYQDYWNDNLAGSTNQKELYIGTLQNTPIPVPPLAEQKRIVKKLEQILPLVDEYDQAQTQLDKLNKELPEALKKSILQQAIQGKLVPQNPKDEPADKLLERITISRHSEHSEESSKKSRKSSSKNPVSRIYRDTDGLWYEQTGSSEPVNITEEIPFEIPETWTWCRLANCSDYGSTKEKVKSFETQKDVWSLDLEDIEKNTGKIIKFLKVSDRKIVGEKIVFKKGQVLYSKLRPYLKKILVAPDDGICSSEIVPVTPIECLDANYLVCVLKSPHVDYTINLVTYGVKMPRVGTDTMLNLLIPLPPLAEQKRIVAKLEQIFKAL